MNHVNRFISVAFLFTFIGGQKQCHANNPKLTVDLMGSGFHRFECFSHYITLASNHRLESTDCSIEHTNCFFVVIFRDLKYVVVFPEYQGKHHTVLIKQPIPADVYVSTDQLDDLKRFNRV